MSGLSLLHSRPPAHPERIALLPAGAPALSQGELFARSQALAGLLRDLGAPGRALLIPATLSPETLCALLACLACGALAVPLPPRAAPAALPPLAVEPWGCLLPPGQEAFFPCPPDGRLLRLSGDRLWLEGGGPYRLEAPGRAAWAAEEGPLPPELPALLLHSSGSTGRPKAIQYPRGQLERFLARNAFLYRQFQEGRPAGDHLACLPPQHLAGLGLCLQALGEGRPLHLLPRFSAAACWRLLKEHSIVLLSLLPGMYAQLLEEEGRCDDQPGISLGEALPPALAERLRREKGIHLFSAYGLSECLSGLGHAGEDIREGRGPAGNCGRHLFGELSLRDAQGREQSDAGEMWVRNDTVFPCYLHEEDAAPRFQDGWFRTGDLFSRDAQGYFHHRGRMDELFVVNGRNLHPRDLEGAAELHPAVAEAAALPLRSRLGRLTPGLLLAPAGRERPDAAAIVEHFLSQPGVPVPGWISWCDSLPRLPGGKLDRQACRRLLEASYRNGAEAVQGHALTS